MTKKVTIEMSVYQAAAVRESLIPNAGDTLWDGDRGQAGAAKEGFFTNTGDRQSLNLRWYLQLSLSCFVAISYRHPSITYLVGKHSRPSAASLKN